MASGSQGKKRMDYICVHYSRDVSGANPTLVETVEWTVLRGTPGTDATAPSVPSGSILDGDADVTVPICSVTFEGLTTGQPKLLIPELTPLATLGDSVSRTIYGSKIISTASVNPTPLIFTTDEYMQLVGHAYNAATDHVSFANGDWSAQETRVASAIFGGGNIYVGLVNSPRNGHMRIDYAITTMA